MSSLIIHHFLARDAPSQPQKSFHLLILPSLMHSSSGALEHLIHSQEWFGRVPWTTDKRWVRNCDGEWAKIRRFLLFQPSNFNPQHGTAVKVWSGWMKWWRAQNFPIVCKWKNGWGWWISFLYSIVRETKMNSRHTEKKRKLFSHWKLIIFSLPPPCLFMFFRSCPCRFDKSFSAKPAYYILCCFYTWNISLALRKLQLCTKINAPEFPKKKTHSNQRTQNSTELPEKNSNSLTFSLYK